MGKNVGFRVAYAFFLLLMVSDICETSFVFGGCDVVRQVEQFREPMRCSVGIRTPLFVA